MATNITSNTPSLMDKGIYSSHESVVMGGYVPLLQRDISGDTTKSISYYASGYIFIIDKLVFCM